MEANRVALSLASHPVSQRVSPPFVGSNNVALEAQRWV